MESLYKKVCDVACSPSHDEQIALILISYTIKKINAYDCQHGLKGLLTASAPSPKAIRLDLNEHSYFLLNLKFYVLHIVRNGLRDSRKLREAATTFKIHADDVKLVERVLAMRKVRSSMRSYIVENYDREDVSEKAFKSVHKRFMQLEPQLRKSVKYKVYSKLRFLSSSFNVELNDFQMEIMIKALQVYMHEVPTKKTDEHLLSYLRTATSNYALNMIQAYTTQKRKRLFNLGDDGFGGSKFGLATMSENQMFKALGVEDEVSYETLQNNSLNSEEESKRLDSLQFDKLVERFGNNRVRRTLLMLLSGFEHPRFTAYLRDLGYIDTVQDNVDYSERVCRETYLEQVCSFLLISIESARIFIRYVMRKAYPEKREVDYGCA